mmetsp:Transcript_12782/g.14359  ORF Transcript_12782/g.14359 Transcript_12782/m.14359 type:complete len:403 (-) Transcript_12782:60-1268(-)
MESTGNRSTGGCEVQYLSNKACVHIMVGNYFKANRILESAIRKHAKDIASTITNYSDLYPYFNSDDSMLVDIDPEVDNDDDEPLFTNSNTIYYDNDHCYNDGHSLQQQETQSISATTETETDNDTFATIHSNRVAVTPFPRMTTTSRLRTFRYCGQCQNDCNHEVYSLPIVTTDAEWETISTEGKSFVLMYNAALCNHLWGMDLTSADLQEQQHRKEHRQHQQQQQQQQVSPLLVAALRSFHVAKNLYRLALQQNYSINGNDSSYDDDRGIDHYDTDVYLIDRFCYPAIFNNMSHLCRTLDGYSSYEAYNYDLMLLSSVYWLIDSASATYTSNTNLSHHTLPSASTSTSASASASTSTSTSVSTSVSTSDYDDNDNDIIDSFMENIFYLIGASDAVVPAKAA